MKKALKDRGYWSHQDSDCCKSWGSFVPRWRGYWCGLKGIVAPHEQVACFFNSILNGMRQPQADPANIIHDVIVTDDTLRRKISEAIGCDLHEKYGVRQKISGKPSDSCDWKLDHLRHFPANGLQWPFQWETYRPQTFDLRMDGLTERERECVIFADACWPPADDGKPFVEFLDVNPTLIRLCSVMLDDDLKVKPCTQIWLPAPSTLVGSSTMIVRYREAGGRVVVRLMEAFENMRFIGYWDHCWSEIPASLRTQKLLFLIANLAGNAFSVFHMGPWSMSAIATYGYFKDWSPSPEETLDQVADSESDSCSSDPFVR